MMDLLFGVMSHGSPWHHVLLALLPLGFGLMLGAASSCCCNQCTFFTDDFNRADSDTIGNGWTEVSGDGDIASNKLSTASSNAIFTQSTTHPSGDPDIRVSVTANVGTSGDIVRIILNYINTSNYWFAEVKAGTGAYLRIYERASGTNYQRTSRTITLSSGANFLFCASISGTSISASVGSTYVNASGSFTSDDWGLGTGALTGTVTFDDVSASITSEDCDPCLPPGARVDNCVGCSGDATYTYQVEIPTVNNGTCVTCTNFAGVYGFGFIENIAGVQCTWQHTYPVSICTAQCTPGCTFNLQFTKTGSDYFVALDLSSLIFWNTTASATPFDCLAFDGFEVPYSMSLFGHCGTASSCFVSAVL